MAARPRKRRTIARFIAPCATLMICAYFAFHATNGHYGTRAHLVMKSRIVKLEARHAGLAAKREWLEHRVALMSDGTIERDMLDEQARRKLAATRADEVVILH